MFKSIKKENGSASLEFLLSALVLLVPMLYLMIFLAEYQARSFAAEGITRHSAILLAQGESEQTPQQILSDVASEVADSFQIPPEHIEFDFDCFSNTFSCPQSGDIVFVRAELVVNPPLIPEWFGLNKALSWRAVSQQEVQLG